MAWHAAPLLHWRHVALYEEVSDLALHQCALCSYTATLRSIASDWVTPAHAQGVAKTDETLLAHEEHLKYRFAQYVRTKAAIERQAGSLAQFAKVRRSGTAGYQHGALLASQPLGLLWVCLVRSPEEWVVSTRRAWPVL